MTSENLKSFLKKYYVMESSDILNKKLLEDIFMKTHEIETLQNFTNALEVNRKQVLQTNEDIFTGYHMNYKIPQINKEFDLLRYNKEKLINIELKSDKSRDPEEVQVKSFEEQMRKNFYYLSSITDELSIYTYHSAFGLYVYKNNQCTKCEFSELLNELSILSPEDLKENIDFDNLFEVKKFLISPFNKTEEFMDDKYFLTQDQQKHKERILNNIGVGKEKVYCIEANAGTGKTLLIYDIAKTLTDDSKNVLIVHCGQLNEGHNKLNTGVNGKKLNIIPAKNLNSHIEWIKNNNYNYDCIIIDEAQRIYESQLKLLCEEIISDSVKTNFIFAYDTKQFLQAREKNNIYNLIHLFVVQKIQENSLNAEYIHVWKDSVIELNLTNKIRTNHELAAFIKSALHLGKRVNIHEYKKVTLEYFSNNIPSEYTELLHDTGWTFINYTPSKYHNELLHKILIPEAVGTSHQVIGQEFEKVVVVLNDNFYYSNNLLEARDTYYDSMGMLYQNMTRVISELKFIVVDNEDVFQELYKIKYNLKK